MKIGLIREGKVPPDRRVPLTPKQCREALDQYPGLQLVAQASPIRCYPDEEYRRAGVPVVEEIYDCDVLLGVKEVPIPQLVPDKTYFFFSHTIKKQAYNRDLLNALLDKRVRMVDWETVVNAKGQRVIAFGRFAGIVGAYNAIWTYGQRTGRFSLKRAYECFDMAEMKSEYAKVDLPAVKIAVTGNGRVSRGAMEVLDGMGLRQVSEEELRTQTFAEPVYAQLKVMHYNKRADGGEFARKEFYESPERYMSDFVKYLPHLDIFIAGAFWDPDAPVLFRIADVKAPDARPAVIADITCDIEGSIPTTVKPSTIALPVYDYDPDAETVKPAFSGERNISVMAIDNLPTELPRDASEAFGRQLLDHVLPHLLDDSQESRIAKATITRNGQLTDRYGYLQAFAEGRE